MLGHPAIVRLLCAVTVAVIMLPVGNWIFPHVAHVVGGLQFEAIEAVLSATLGFGLYIVLFG